jgi:hypothetical protein
MFLLEPTETDRIDRNHFRLVLHLIQSVSVLGIQKRNFLVQSNKIPKIEPNWTKNTPRSYEVLSAP